MGKNQWHYVCKYDQCLSNLGLSGEEEVVAGDVSRDKTFHIRVKWKHISGQHKQQLDIKNLVHLRL